MNMTKKHGNPCSRVHLDTRHLKPLRVGPRGSQVLKVSRPTHFAISIVLAFNDTILVNAQWSGQLESKGESGFCKKSDARGSARQSRGLVYGTRYDIITPSTRPLPMRNLTNRPPPSPKRNNYNHTTPQYFMKALKLRISILQGRLFTKLPFKAQDQPHNGLPIQPSATSPRRSLFTTKMSWMDSWSRPSKHQATPAPYYLLPGGEATPYCHSCGRVINSRRTVGGAGEDKGQGNVVKYCSSRCRTHKPGKLDREIEGVFVGMLSGEGVGGGDAERGRGAGGMERRDGGKKGKKGGGTGKKKIKGDARVLVSCEEVERVMFGRDEEGDSHSGSGSGDEEDGSEDGGNKAQLHDDDGNSDSHKENHHQQRNLDARDNTGTLEDPTAAQHQPDIDYDVLARLSVRSGTRVRPPQHISEVNGSVGGEKGRAERIDETGDMLEKRRAGQRRARRREMVRCAARRGVVFGFVVADAGAKGENEKERGETERKKCEAVMSGKVVEPSYAKGNWSIRWRE